MTIQSEGNALWVRCASNDGTVARIEADLSNITIAMDNDEAGESIAGVANCLIIPRAEAMMLGHWLIAAAKEGLPE